MNTCAPQPRPAVAGAFFALVAATAGIAAHGLAEGNAVAPSFDALFLLTAGVLALGAAAGAGASAVSEWAADRPGTGAAWLHRICSLRLAGILLPVTAAQWFSHVVLVGDHRVRAALAGASTAPGHVHGAAPELAGGLPAAGHAVAWLPMLSAHAAGVLVCVVLLALLGRVLDAVAARVTVPAPRPSVPPRAPRARRAPFVVHGRVRCFAVAPRAPPQLLAA